MLPCLPGFYHANHALIHAEFSAERVTRERRSTDRMNFLGRQLGGMVLLALRRVVSIAKLSIACVGLIIAKAEVCGIAAGSVIATVQYEHTRRRNGLIVRKSPSNTVRVDSPARHIERAIAITAVPSGPRMATNRIGCRIDLGHKTIGEFFRSVLVTAHSRTVRLVWLSGRYVKGVITMLTVSTCENASSHVTSLGSVVRSAVGGQILIALRYFSRVPAVQS